jgi:hypothetical protein
MPEISVIRRANLLALLQEYAESYVANGTTTTGIDQSFAAHIQVHPSMLSQMKTGRPISDKLAKQIESACKRTVGWLSEQHPDQKPSPGEDAFMALARDVWRAQNAKGKRVLTLAIKTFIAKSD